MSIDLHCCNNLDLLKQIDSNSIDLIILDPPSGAQLVKDNWDLKMQSYEKYIVERILESERVLKDTGSLYLSQWIGKKNPTEMAKVLIEIEEYTNLIFQNFITWRKNRGFGVSKNWMFVREEVLFYTKSNDYIYNVQYSDTLKRNYIRKGGKSYYKRASNVWIDINESSYENIQNQDYSLNRTHKSNNSTEKPIAFYKRIINASSNINDVVLDLYLGNGNSINACVELGRNIIGCDIDSTANGFTKKDLQKIKINKNKFFK